MSTCPNCLKKYKCLSRHLYTSFCITIRSKLVNKRRFVSSKHKWRPEIIQWYNTNAMLGDEDKMDYECNNNYDTSFHVEKGIDDNLNNLHIEQEEKLHSNTKERSSENDMILLYETLKHNTNQNYDPNYYVWIKLLKILEELNAPLNAFD